MNNRERLDIIRKAKQEGYKGSYIDLFNNKKSDNTSSENTDISSKLDPQIKERLKTELTKSNPQRQKHRKESMQSVIDTVKRDLYNNPIFSNLYNDTNFNIKIADSDRTSKKPNSWTEHIKFWDAEDYNTEIEHPDPGKDVIELFINSDAYHNSDMSPSELRSLILGDVLSGLTEKDPQAKELKNQIWDAFPPLAKENIKDRVYPESRKNENQTLEDFISTDFLDGYVRGLIPEGTSSIQQSYKGNDKGFYRGSDLKKYYNKAYTMNPELKQNIKDISTYLGAPFESQETMAVTPTFKKGGFVNKFELGGITTTEPTDPIVIPETYGIIREEKDPVKDMDISEIDFDLLYKAITRHEHRSGYEEGTFNLKSDYNTNIRTKGNKKNKKGSSAYGDIQLTKKILNNITTVGVRRYYNVEDVDVKYHKKLLAQANNFLTYGGDDMVEGFERYDYGQVGDLTTEEDKRNYKILGTQILQGEYRRAKDNIGENEIPLTKMLENYYGGEGKSNYAKNVIKHYNTLIENKNVKPEKKMNYQQFKLEEYKRIKEMFPGIIDPLQRNYLYQSRSGFKT